MSFLDRFQPQARVAGKQARQAARTSALPALREALERVLSTGRYPSTPHFSFEQSLRLLGGIRYGAQEVRAFSAQLVTCQEKTDFFYKAGAFLSALAECSADDLSELQLRALSQPLDRLGYHNRRDLVIHGGAGDALATKMSGGSVRVLGNVGNGAGRRVVSGSVVIEGDAGENLGMDNDGAEIIVRGTAGACAGRGQRGGILRVDRHAGPRAGYLLSGGRVIVAGNAGDEAGREMAGGELVVEGSAGDDVGVRLRGGVIRVSRRIGSLGSPRHGGEILVGSRRVHPRGE